MVTLWNNSLGVVIKVSIHCGIASVAFCKRRSAMLKQVPHYRTPRKYNPMFLSVDESRINLVHLADESVDLVLAVTEVTTLDVVLELAGAETTVGVAELERPQEVGGLLEVGSDSEDLVDQILHTEDTVLAKVVLDDGVVGKRLALLLDLSVTTLVDELLDALEVGVTVGDPGLDNLDHLDGGLGDLDEDTVVDLEKTEELEDLAGLGGNLVDTLDTDNEDELLLGGDVVRALLLGNAVEADLLALSIAVLLDVLLSTLEDNSALLLVEL